MEIAITAILAVLFGVLVGFLGGFFGKRLINSKRIEESQAAAVKVLEEAEEQKRQILIEAREEGLQLRTSVEQDLKERRSELQRSERRITNREENVERRSANLEKREKTLAQQEKAAEKFQEELDELKQQELQRLEAISNLSVTDAREQLMKRAEEDIQHDLALRYRDMEDIARDEANSKARVILSTVIHRLAAEVVSEVTVTTVPLPSDDMKGRLIGREGRNIRAIEKHTGVDLIIDDTPEAVTISCFDPIRREVARLALSKLIADGRIHPARIEEMVNRSEKEVADAIWKSGEEAVFDVGVRGLNPEVIKLLGRLRYRYSYGENVLQHSIEVAHVAGMLASEIGANVKVAKTGGLLHDIGKALTHEVEGPHAEIGAEVGKKYSVPANICACIAEHHDDVMSSPEAFLVSAADAISAARPGARKDTVENYIKRLQALEEVGMGFEGVDKCFAIQAGREIRVMVKPQDVDDVAASKMARDIVKKIDDTLVYPGQIKVTVIRESRNIEYAR
jgi:ribonuclease Y